MSQTSNRRVECEVKLRNALASNNAAQFASALEEALKFDTIEFDEIARKLLETKLSSDGAPECNRAMAIHLLPHVSSQSADKLLERLIAIDPLLDMVQSEKDGDDTSKREERLSPAMFRLANQLASEIERSTALGKSLLAIWKSNLGLCLDSPLCVLTMLIQSQLGSRHAATGFDELRKAVSKLWKLQRELSSTHWFDDLGANARVAKIRSWFRDLLSFGVREMDGDDQKILWLDAVVSFCRSLIDCAPQPLHLGVQHGRMLEDSRQLASWASATCALAIKIDSRSVSRNLPTLLQSIISASHEWQSILLIDVLLEVVRSSSVAVLNESKHVENVLRWVCRVRPEVSVRLVRGVLPVMVKRPALRASLLSALKKELLGARTQTVAVPLLFLMLRAAAPHHTTAAAAAAASSNNALSQSQSFASFSTQAMRKLGKDSLADESVQIEVVGVLARCLTQTAATKTVFYEQAIETVTKCPQLTTNLLDMLVAHAATLPTLDKQSFVIATKTLVDLREPLAHLLHAIGQLSCRLSINIMETEGGTNEDNTLVNKSDTVLREWINTACMLEEDDLQLDKNAEWNPTTTDGRATLLFAHSMVALYDVLIEHLFRVVSTLERTDDVTYLRQLLVRRSKLQETLKSQMVARKEGKAVGKMALPDLSAPPASAGLLSSIFERLCTDGNDNDMSRELEDLRMPLVDWAIVRSIQLSEFINSSAPTTVVISTKSVAALTRHLWTIWGAINERATSLWVQNLLHESSIRQGAQQAYEKCLLYLLDRLQADRASVGPLFKDLWARLATNVPIKMMTLLKDHVDVLITCLGELLESIDDLNLCLSRYKRDNPKDNSAQVQEYRRKIAGLEKAAKVVTSIIGYLMNAMTSQGTRLLPWCIETARRILHDKSLNNAGVMRDCLKLFVKFGIQSLGVNHPQSPQLFETTLLELARQSYKMESISSADDDNDGTIDDTKNDSARDMVPPFACVIMMNSQRIATAVAEAGGEMCAKLRLALQYVQQFGTRTTERMDSAMSLLLERFDSVWTLAAEMLCFLKIRVVEEKIVEFLAEMFTVLETIVKLLSEAHRRLSKVTEWTSIERLGLLCQDKQFLRVLERAAELVGEVQPGADQTAKKRKEGKKIDQTLYVRYIRARESMQSQILLLCQATKCSDINLQVKENTAGMRDFHINRQKFMSHMAEREEDDDDGGGGEDGDGPTRSKRVRTRDSDQMGGDENEDPNQDD